LFLGAVILFGFATWYLVDDQPSRAKGAFTGLVVMVLWVWFFVDFLIRFVLARGARKWFLRTRRFDLVSLALPFLRPFLIIMFIWRIPALRHGEASKQRLRYLIVTVIGSFLYVYVCASLVFTVERHADGANIKSFGDAIWWGFVTIATVGYGDFVPVTVPGRVIAIGLMVGGIIVVAVTTGTVVSSLMDRVRRVITIEQDRVGDSPGATGAGISDDGHRNEA